MAPSETSPMNSLRRPSRRSKCKSGRWTPVLPRRVERTRAAYIAPGAEASRTSASGARYSAGPTSSGLRCTTTFFTIFAPYGFGGARRVSVRTAGLRWELSFGEIRTSP